jgi:replicative DNA helicase
VVKLQQEDPIQVAAAMIKAGRELAHLLNPKGEMFGTGDFDRAYHRYQQKVARGPGASFGHAMLDEYFYGMLGLTFWIAPPKRYKSWMMLQALAENVEQGRAAWLYSLELPAEESDMRLRCLLADVPWWHYTKNCIRDNEWDRIREASELIDGCGMYRIVKPPEGERDMDAMVHKARDAGADVIFFDQLQYIEVDGESLGSWNDTKKYWKVLNRARDLSDEVPLGIAHQFNREAMYADSMPPVQNAKGSSAIEETATLALGMFASKDMLRSGLVEVGTLIARNHMYAAWEMEVELSRGCSFNIEKRIEDE